MATAKRARINANQAAGTAIAVAPAADPTVCPVTVNVFDGTRQLIPQGTSILITVTDGAQNQLYRGYVSGPTIHLTLPIHNNFADNYSIIAFANGYEQAGFQPVTVGPHAPQTLDLMLLAKDGILRMRSGMIWRRSGRRSRRFSRRAPPLIQPPLTVN